jgi:hypothetical protein
MRKDKDKIIASRKSGLSYLQISKKFGIPKSTLSLWLKNIKLSKSAQSKIDLRVNDTSVKALIERNKAQTQIAKDRHQRIIKEAKKSFLKFKKESLFIAGVSLYWGEGYKKGARGSSWRVIDLANSDPDLVKVFLKFLKKYLKVDNDDIYIQLIIAPNKDINAAVVFWSKVTKLDKSRFIKTYSKVSSSSKGIRNKESLPFGTIHVRINNVDKFFTLIGWIECLKTI